jgi:hypothetical protein
MKRKRKKGEVFRRDAEASNEKELLVSPRDFPVAYPTGCALFASSPQVIVADFARMLLPW